MIDNLADGANKFEVLLVGSSNPTLTIGGNHFLFNINNWNSSLEQFRKGFEDNNIVKDIKTLKKELNLLKKDDNVKELFKDINYDNIANNVESQSVQKRKRNITKIRDSEFA